MVNVDLNSQARGFTAANAPFDWEKKRFEEKKVVFLSKMWGEKSSGPMVDRIFTIQQMRHCNQVPSYSKHMTVGRKCLDLYLHFFYIFPPEKLGGVRGHAEWWASDNRSLVILEDNFMKFWMGVPVGTNYQGQNYFSPGGTHRGNSTIFTKLSQIQSQGE